MRALLLILIALAPMIYGQEPKPHSDAHKRHAASENKTPADTSVQPVMVINQEAPTGQDKDHSKQPPSYLHELLLPTNALTLALVIVGVIGIVTAICTLRTVNRQVGAMLESNNILRESFTSVQRPFILFPARIQMSKLVDQKKSFQGWAVYTEIENAGNAPAWVRLHVNYRYQPDELASDFSYPDLGDTSDILTPVGPKSSIWCSPIPISHDVIQAVCEKKKRLYFYGWAT